MGNITNGDIKYNNSDEDDCAREHIGKVAQFLFGGVNPNQLEIDTENIINWEDGYVALEDTNVHRIPMPITLMDAGHHFEEVPRIA